MQKPKDLLAVLSCPLGMAPTLCTEQEMGWGGDFTQISLEIWICAPVPCIYPHPPSPNPRWFLYLCHSPSFSSSLLVVAPAGCGCQEREANFTPNFSPAEYSPRQDPTSLGCSGSWAGCLQPQAALTSPGLALTDLARGWSLTQPAGLSSRAQL